MANYYGTTVSSGGKIKKGSESAIKEIIAKYTFGNEGELNVELSVIDQSLQIWGYDSCYAYPKMEDGELDFDQETFDGFLNEISKYLEEPLIVSEVGSEKCRYVNACAYIVKPNKDCEFVSLEDEINKKLK